MAEQYPLADQLKSEFRGRGAAVSGMQATPTSELMHRAEMGEDPRVNVAEEAFRESYRARQYASSSAPSRPPRASRPAADGSGGMNGADNPMGPIHIPRRSPADVSSHPSRPAYSARRGTTPDPQAQGTAPSRAASYRFSQTGGRDTLSEEIAGAGRARHRASEAREEQPEEKISGSKKKEKIRVRRTRAARRKAAAPAQGNEEIEVQKGSFPVMFVAVCLIAVALLFSIVESFAEVYQISSSISRKEAELAALRETAAGLELKLDEKNDIRTIRNIAVGELGMAEEDSMQRRFVSVSGGERIEILEAAEEEKNDTPGGVLFSSLTRLFDRFR